MGCVLLRFYIRFTDKTISNDGDGFEIGELKLMDFTEVFQAPISYWKKDDYERQWQEGLRRILQGHDKSCLVTSMYNPLMANFIVWWPMYLHEGKVYIQNHLLFMSELKQPFEEPKLYEYIHTRETYSIDGDKVSEWSLDMRDIAIFFNSINII